MATQTLDGNWSNTEPIDSAIESLKGFISEGKAKRFLIGSNMSIEEEKVSILLEDRIKELEDIVKDFVSCKESIIKIPSSVEVEKFSINI